MLIDSRTRHPTVAVVIPTLNRNEDIERLLYCIIKNNIYPDEVIICDQSDNDLTKECVNKYVTKTPGIYYKYIKTDRKSAVFARNLIMDETECDYIVLIDDDALISDSFFSTVKKKITPNIHAINIRYIESKDFRKVYKKYDEFRKDLEKIYNFGYKMSCLGFVTNWAYMFTLNSYRKKGKLKLNRIKRVIHDYSSKLDKRGDVISGFAVLSKEIYKKYKFDENLGEGYTLMEDNEFSAQISKSYPVYMYGDLWAYHNKNLTDLNRPPDHEIIFRHYKNSLYIFEKHSKLSLFNRILFFYSRIGFFLINSVKIILLRHYNLIRFHLIGLSETAKKLFF